MGRRRPGRDKACGVAPLLRSPVMEAQELCFPELLNASCRRLATSWSQVVIKTAVICFISALAVLLNLLIIISVSHFRQLHTPTNFFLLSLSVTDFLLGLVQVPFEVYTASGCWWFGDFLCNFYNSLMLVFTSSSVGNMVLISADRYVAICDPLQYINRVTQRKVKLGICLCWFCSVLYNGALVSYVASRREKGMSCYGHCEMFLDFAIAVFDIIVTFIVPVTAIVVLYTRVFVAAVSQARALRSHVGVKTTTSERKAARTIGILVLVFLMCFCPYYSLTMATDSPQNSLAASYTVLVFYFNSCLNPLIYALFYPWFRRSVKLIVTLRILKPGSRHASLM